MREAIFPVLLAIGKIIAGLIGFAAIALVVRALRVGRMPAPREKEDGNDY
jgi:hypothetical protein